MSDTSIHLPGTPQASGDAEVAEPEGRRSFMALVVGVTGACYAAALGYPVYRYLASPVERAGTGASVSEILLPEAQKLPSATALMFKFNESPALLIHHADDRWAAFSAVCTHLGCTVQFQPEQNRIYCACHGGVYDMYSGANVSGPPPRPLPQFVVKLQDKGVLISRA